MDGGVEAGAGAGAGAASGAESAAEEDFGAEGEVVSKRAHHHPWTTDQVVAIEKCFYKKRTSATDCVNLLVHDFGVRVSIGQVWTVHKAWVAWTDENAKKSESEQTLFSVDYVANKVRRHGILAQTGRNAQQTAGRSVASSRKALRGLGHQYSENGYFESISAPMAIADGAGNSTFSMLFHGNLDFRGTSMVKGSFTRCCRSHWRLSECVLSSHRLKCVNR